MRKQALLLLLLIGTAITTPAAAATFTVSVSSPVGTPSCGFLSANETAPTGRSLTCAPIGGASLLDGEAAATFGHVGGTASAAVGSGYFGTAFGIGTNATFSDFVTFKSDPSITSATVAANLAFSGALNSTGAATAGVDLFYSLFGPGLIFSATDDSGIARNDFGVAEGTVLGGSIDALLRTRFVVVPTNTPLLMTLGLGTFSGVGGSGSPESASSRFSNSFEVPFGIDAFVLPDGVTANAGDWLVNNRRVGAAAVVPEPAAWAMMLLGFGAVGHLVRRRRALATFQSSDSTAAA